MAADNGTRQVSMPWISAEYADIENASASTIEVLETNGSIFILNCTDLTSPGGGVDLEAAAAANGTEDGSGLSADEATMELITMIATAFVLGLVILATVIGKYEEMIQTVDFSCSVFQSWKFAYITAYKTACRRSRTFETTTNANLHSGYVLILDKRLEYAPGNNAHPVFPQRTRIVI
jgi:hypothetical protein